jgi:hypothetical protein
MAVGEPAHRAPTTMTSNISFLLSRARAGKVHARDFLKLGQREDAAHPQKYPNRGLTTEWVELLRDRWRDIKSQSPWLVQIRLRW